MGKFGYFVSQPLLKTKLEEKWIYMPLPSLLPAGKYMEIRVDAIGFLNYAPTGTDQQNVIVGSHGTLSLFTLLTE